MEFSKPVTVLIRQRFSCRRYLDTPIAAETRERLEAFLTSHTAAPLGTSARFHLIAATDENRQALRGLGTYGTIRNPAGFVIGAVTPGEKNLEGFGYLMEQAVLFVTDLGLGTCWLGGFFTRSSFSRAIGLGRGETIPAVFALGQMATPNAEMDIFRRFANSAHRLAWERLFFDRSFDAPLSREAAEVYAEPLDTVQWAPSASNKQPWRIVRDGGGWHFYMQRTAGYHNPLTKLVRVVDLQRVDLGIAMCHFELTALELGLAGSWQIRDPGIANPDSLAEYVVTWAG
jgi:nitroreductase